MSTDYYKTIYGSVRSIILLLCGDRRKTKLLYTLTDLPHAVGNVTVVNPFKRSFLLVVGQSDPVESLRTDTRLLLKIKPQHL